MAVFANIGGSSKQLSSIYGNIGGAKKNYPHFMPI